MVHTAPTTIGLIFQAGFEQVEREFKVGAGAISDVAITGPHNWRSHLKEERRKPSYKKNHSTTGSSIRLKVWSLKGHGFETPGMHF